MLMPLLSLANHMLEEKPIVRYDGLSLLINPLPVFHISFWRISIMKHPVLKPELRILTTPPQLKTRRRRLRQGYQTHASYWYVSATYSRQL
jgi:hypothetical protein